MNSNAHHLLATSLLLGYACGSDKEDESTFSDDASQTTDNTDTYVDSNDGDNVDTSEDSDDTDAPTGSAFDQFSENVTIYVDGEDVVFETIGHPDHTSPYWSPSHQLNVAPTVTNTSDMAPGYIDDFNGTYTLRVPGSPELASSSSSTGLGAIGIAVSGGVIYNDEEGPNVPLDSAVPSLDYSGAHTGPQSYHYHLEPKAWSEDDEVLIGIISDGFYLYGRKCNSTGTYPTNLDESGGHTHTTQHGNEDEYHYHVQNETYLNEYYILFPGDYQGTPNAIQ